MNSAAALANKVRLHFCLHTLWRPHWYRLVFCPSDNPDVVSVLLGASYGTLEGSYHLFRLRQPTTPPPPPPPPRNYFLQYRSTDLQVLSSKLSTSSPSSSSSSGYILPFLYLFFRFPFFVPTTSTCVFSPFGLRRP